MDCVKNRRGRSKFFTCFHPDFTDDDPGRRSKSSVRREKRDHRGFAAAIKAVFLKTSSGNRLRNKNYTTRQDDTFRSDSNYSSSAANAKSVNNTSSKNSGELLLLRTNSNASSIFSPGVTDSSTSSSRSSSISSNSRSVSERINRQLDFKQTSNQQQSAMKRVIVGEKCGCTVGMCIFFICLVSLVFWGKVFAIVTCTSACLFFGTESAASIVTRC